MPCEGTGWIVALVLLASIGMLALVCGITGNRHVAQRAGHIKQLHQARAPMASVEFAIQSRATVEITERVRGVLARLSTKYLRNHPGVTPDLLHPSDQLVDELAFDLDSLSGIELIIELEKEFGRKMPGPRSEAEWKELSTVAGVTRLVSRACNESDAKNSV